MNVGFIGYGNMGHTHTLLVEQNEGVKLTAVADAREERRRMAFEEHPGIAVYSEGMDLIAAGGVDVVFVCCPTYLHSHFAIAAMEAGCDVFCEKPMALTPAQCDEMIAAEARTGRSLMIGQVLRFWPEYVYLKNTIENGSLGKLNALSMTRVGGVSIGWERWFLDEAKGGMQIFDRHIHDTDAIIWMLGTPKAVRTHAATRDPHTEGGLFHSFTQYLYDGNMVVSAEGSADAPAGFPFTASYRAFFENGVLDFNGTRKPDTLLLYDGTPGGKAVDLPQPMEESSGGLNITTRSAYLFEEQYFFGCLKKGVKPQTVTPSKARETIRVVRAEIESARSGNAVEL